jgi:hypothetical protein
VELSQHKYIWVKKAIDLKEQQFNHRAYVALKSVADRLIHDSKYNVQFDGINQKSIQLLYYGF